MAFLGLPSNPAYVERIQLYNIVVDPTRGGFTIPNNGVVFGRGGPRSLPPVEGSARWRRFYPQTSGPDLAWVQISDNCLSRVHCAIAPTQGAWYAIDLGSTGGIYTNDEQLKEPWKLGEGDTLMIGGGLRWQFRFSEA
jgi:hypothetical protein